LNSKILIITGSEDQGVSCLAKLLKTQDIYFGKKEFFPPGDGNLEGFWGHMSFLSINTKLLETFHGSWDNPPILPENWEKNETLKMIEKHAEKLIEQFIDKPLWGWNDSRTSLFLPFWRNIIVKTIPNAEIFSIICIRRPWDAAAYFENHHNFDTDKSIKLWIRYTYDSLIYTKKTRKLFIEYESLTQKPQDEIERIHHLLKEL
jgi:hypothetical protein